MRVPVTRPSPHGIFSYWTTAHLARRPIRYIGFGGERLRVRDAFHSHGLTQFFLLQIRDPTTNDPDRE